MKVIFESPFIQRNGYIEQVWRVEYQNKFFNQLILVRGTEPEARAYMESEMGFMGRYRACTEKELSAANVLKLPIYIAPKL